MLDRHTGHSWLEFAMGKMRYPMEAKGNCKEGYQSCRQETALARPLWKHKNIQRLFFYLYTGGFFTSVLPCDPMSLLPFFFVTFCYLCRHLLRFFYKFLKVVISIVNDLEVGRADVYRNHWVETLCLWTLLIMPSRFAAYNDVYRQLARLHCNFHLFMYGEHGLRCKAPVSHIACNTQLVKKRDALCSLTCRSEFGDS